MKLYNRFFPYFLIIFVTVISTLILWSPFLFRQTSWFGLNIKESNFQYIYRHFDGPLYIIPAKTFYNFNHINPSEAGLINSLPSGEKYFAAHLPLYPLLIRVVKEFSIFGGYLKSMLIVNLLSTIALSLFFYYLLKKLKISNKPLILILAFLFLPRFLVVRSIGAPESLFMLLILFSVFFFEKENYLLAGLAGGLAAATKTPGILLFFVYLFCIAERYIKTKRFNWHWLNIILIPLGLISVFILYAVQYKDFFAYFHSGNNIHLVAPFSVFNWQAKWVGTAWLEDAVFYFLLYILTVIMMYKTKYRSFFYFSLIYLISLIFVQHRDISRYSLPLWPFACIAFENFFTSKKFLIAALVLLPAVYLYAWNFLNYNVMPVADWRIFY